ncbi:hypothetical protein J132_10762 [Termitomyces sp. J132]|nr:hypothetical protein J132_10762 [Termitomyces sp. J132]
MPDWRSPQELQKEELIFSKFTHALFGLYIYEWFISLDFEWQFISRKKQFRWPLIFYFAGRYLLLCAMIGIAISLDTTTKINCQALYTFTQLAGNSSVGLASINLSIRTMAVWSRDRYIIGFLVVLILGHWSLILQGVNLSVIWVDSTGCVITWTNNKILAATFVYSMCFDLVVLALNAYKLLDINAKEKGFMSSRIAKMIFEDGLIYFVIAFLANLLATVFMIVASRVVRRLAKYSNPQVLHSAHSGPVAFRGAQTLPRHATSFNPNIPTAGVHVQMETFTREEDYSTPEIKPVKRFREDSDTEHDLEGKARSL